MIVQTKVFLNRAQQRVVLKERHVVEISSPNALKVTTMECSPMLEQNNPLPVVPKKGLNRAQQRVVLKERHVVEIYSPNALKVTTMECIPMLKQGDPTFNPQKGGYKATYKEGLRFKK